jgi:6-bladed beta-propeller
MRYLKQYRFYIVIGISLIVINIVALRSWLPVLRSRGAPLTLPRSLQPSGILRYGTQLPELAGPRLIGDKDVVIAQDQTNLILYLSLYQNQSYSIATAKTVELLRHRYGKGRFNAYAIVRGDLSDIRSLVEHSLINYDVMTDPDGSLGRKLGIGESESAVFLFDGQGACLFSTRYTLTPEDLRQLVAMEILHVDPLDNAFFKRVRIEEGQRFGPLSLTNAQSLEQTNLEKVTQGVNKLVFFTAACSACSLPSYLASFTEFEQNTRSAGSKPQNSVLVFDFNFSQSDVLKSLKEANITAPAYVANEELPALAQANNKVGKIGQAAVAETDGHGTVVKVSSLTASRSSEDSKSAVAGLQPADADGAVAVYEDIFRGISVAPYHVASYEGKYFVSDVKRNRLLVLDEDQRVQKEIGRIGSGPGRFTHPKQVGVAADGVLYVYDAYNDRIERFGPDGNYIDEFRTTLFQGFAISPKSEVYLGQPEKGSLIAVYSGSGQQLRSFGKLKRFSDVYGSKYSYKDDLYRLAINRVNIAIDKDGYVYASFMLAPLIQKYSPDGRLVFERRLEGPDVDNLTRVILTDTKEKYVTTSIDGFQENAIAIDPVVDPTTGNIYVIFIDGSIYLVDPNGQPIRLLRPKSTRGFFYPDTAAIGAKNEVLVVSFMPKICFRLVLPDTSGKVSDITGP